MNSKDVEMENSDKVQISTTRVTESMIQRDKDFLKKNRSKLKSIKVIQSAKPSNEFLKHLCTVVEAFGNKTSKLKSIIDEFVPVRENDLPILQHEDISDFIVNGFEDNKNMEIIKIFSAKWANYIDDRKSKDKHKDCLNQKYEYHSNRLPKNLTARFIRVKNASDEIRVKAYLTVFIPKYEIKGKHEDQRYKDAEVTKVNYEKLIIFGILSPMNIGSIPDVKFYTNHLRESCGFEYTSKTFTEPLYIKEWKRVEDFMTILLRDIFKLRSTNVTQNN